jgi:tetraacyldisaccharide 4'-kinase
MNSLSKKIHTLMHTDPNGRPSYLEMLMKGVSVIYGACLKIRVSGYKSGLWRSKKLPCKVISVGNITAGGTGKTPMTVYLARRIHQMGYRAAVLSRGYRGRAEKSGGIVSNGREILMGSQRAGDEPYMMATYLKTIEVPVLVGRDRHRIGLLALEKFNPDVIILDDGFQHLSLARDINLVLLDSRRPFGNHHLLPRGPLREPVSSLSRGDAFVFTRFDSASNDADPVSLAWLKEALSGHPIYRSHHIPFIYKVIKGGQSAPESSTPKPIPFELESIKGRRVFAFSGIARNDDFRRTVESFKCDIRGFTDFPDHHRYSDHDFNALLRSARDIAADIILTTEKDYVRFEHRTQWPVDLVVIGIQISFGQEDRDFTTFIKNRLEKC